VWAGVVAPSDKIGAGIAKTARRQIVAADVHAYALDPSNAEALWKKSEELVGESFE
jgi:surface antigen